MRRTIGRLACILLFPVVAGPVSGQSVKEVFEQVKGSVVIIHTTQTEYPYLTTASPVSVEGTGSGVLVSETEVLTAAHVVQVANSVTVEFPSGEEIRASVIASRPTQDVAMLRLAEPVSISPARMGDSDRTSVGDQVVVVGAPLGEGHTLTVGHVSARRAERGLFYGVSTVEYLQTDAAINPGNSGGPMFNMSGEVVGVVSHILTLSGGSMGLGFAVTSNTARQVLQPGVAIWSGMGGSPVKGTLAKILNIPPPGAGIMVGSVAIGSVSESLGLRPATIPIKIATEEFMIGGDIIISVLGIPVGGSLEGLEAIQAAVGRLSAGETLRVTVLRDGELTELSARVR